MGPGGTTVALKTYAFRVGRRRAHTPSYINGLLALERLAIDYVECPAHGTASSDTATGRKTWQRKKHRRCRPANRCQDCARRMPWRCWNRRATIAAFATTVPVLSFRCGDDRHGLALRPHRQIIQAALRWQHGHVEGVRDGFRWNAAVAGDRIVAIGRLLACSVPPS